MVQSENYKPNHEMVYCFESLGLSLAESLILTAQIEVEEVWDIIGALEMMTRHPEAIKLNVLAEVIAYRKRWLSEQPGGHQSL